MADYQAWKNSVLGRVLNIDGSDPGQCTQVALSWGEAQFPGVAWNVLFPPVPAAKEMFTHVNTQYFQAIANDHNNPNQVPEQGDIMVFDATPQAGYTNTYNNPYGHVGVCDGVAGLGFALVQENAPAAGEPVNVTTYSWHYRPCLGWLRAKVQAPAPAPAPAPTTTTTTTQAPAPETTTTTTTAAPAPVEPDPTTTTTTTTTTVNPVDPQPTTTTPPEVQTATTTAPPQAAQSTSWLTVIWSVIIAIIERLQGKVK